LPDSTPDLQYPGDGHNAGPVPRHVAIIMDGNGRWAVQRAMGREAGHRQGVSNIQHVVQILARRGVSVVTLYAFSTENWTRPAPEVDALMTILADEIEPQTREMDAAGVRLVHLGDPDPLHPQLRRAVAEAQQRTQGNSAVTLNIAFNYGGRDEILRAVRQIIADGLSPEQVDEALFSRYLYTDGCPDPDLIIRTGGEQRISNFLLWQGAYSEYYHTPVLWPDLDEDELDAALDAYRQRQRRFGGLNESNRTPGE
jgi:undecaprenyl diphosphate synthase